MWLVYARGFRFKFKTGASDFGGRTDAKIVVSGHSDLRLQPSMFTISINEHLYTKMRSDQVIS